MARAIPSHININQPSYLGRVSAVSKSRKRLRSLSLIETRDLLKGHRLERLVHTGKIDHVYFWHDRQLVERIAQRHEHLRCNRMTEINTQTDTRSRAGTPGRS
jgi:hypothetical protein